MKILLVDDSIIGRKLLKKHLNNAGHNEIIMAESASEAFEELGMNNSAKNPHGIDLILMDILMPEMNGIEACKKIKAAEVLKDIPVVMVTVNQDDQHLKMAFEAGASDYVTKPIHKVVLLARIQSILTLKKEIDHRVAVTLELKEANRKLKLLSSEDGLTGVANRRHFDNFFENEWHRAMRFKRASIPLSLLMIDVDYFKAYNDNYGHQAGDICLKKVAGALNNITKRPGDIVARYGGEEFVIVFSDTDINGAAELAEIARNKVETLKIPHEYSNASDNVTVSIGAASRIPQKDIPSSNLISEADKMLYQAKKEGRNRVVLSKIPC